MKNLKWILILLTIIFSTNAVTGSSKITSRNKLSACVLEDLATAGLGDIKYSALTEAQFQNVNGAGWVLMKAQSKTELGILTGEASIFDYFTTGNSSMTFLPDGRGIFLRGKNNGSTLDPDGERLIGSYSVDNIRSHTHRAKVMYNAVGGQGGSPVRADGAFGNDSGVIEAFGGAETRPKNVSVNTFIKAKRNCLDAVTISLINSNTTNITELQNYNLKNQCDACINLPETNLTDLGTKLACFKNEVDLYEADQKNWSVTCTARTVGYAKRVLMLIGASRTEEDNIWLSHLDNQYPYYNVISVN